MTDLLIREEPASRTERRRKRAVRRFFARLLVALIVLGLGAGAVYLAGPGADPKVEPSAPAAAGPPVQETVLVAMTLKGDSSQQADSLTLFGSGAGSPVGLFIPSGTLATIPGQGFEPVAKALAFGRPSLLHLATENLLGITIDQTLVLDDLSLARMVDALGGVQVEVTERLLEKGEDGRSEVVFPLGVQQMTGAQAAVYMTYRAPRETELSRFPRMQKVWEAILAKLETSASPEQVFAGISGAMVDPAAVEAFSTTMRTLAAAPDPELLFDVLPAKPIGAGDDRDGYDLDEAAAADRVEKLFAASLPEGQPQADARPRVELRNGVGTPEAGEQVASMLVPAGMKIEVTGNAGRFDHEKTKIVVYAATEDAMSLARRVRDLLGMGTIEIATRPQTVVDVTVVIGKDFGA